MNENTRDISPTVCLDAAVVKLVRERQQLTQLYVSKVVGVTTDTISRWENNRYPTIRRENALKLAEALGVPLEEILQKPAVDSLPDALPAPPVQRRFLPWLAAAVLALVAMLSAYLLHEPPPQPASVTAERVLPAFAAPGSTLPVQIQLSHHDKGGGFIVREYFPKGWKVVQSSPPASSLDNVNGIVRWIIKAGDERKRVVYLVQVDTVSLHSEAAFKGEIVASKEGNQSAVEIGGKAKLAVAPVHWADTDGNGRIDDGEMLEGSFTIEDMSGVHMEWKDLEALWVAGSYAWDAGQGRFVPAAKQP